jgi:hypothetical protein
MHVYSLARIETLLPHAKENNSMVDASSKLCKRTKHPLSSNKSVAIEKTYILPIMFANYIPRGHLDAIHATMDMYSHWTINNDDVHRKLDWNTNHNIRP